LVVDIASRNQIHRHQFDMCCDLKVCPVASIKLDITEDETGAGSRTGDLWKKVLVEETNNLITSLVRIRDALKKSI